MRRLTALVLIALLGACGGGDDGAAATRTVEIEMRDIAFEPETLQVEQGEKIRFRFRNTGKLPHDAFIGDAEAQTDHEREMRDQDDGGHEHGDDGTTVEPGQTGELTHTFAEAGTVEIGCHQRGHYDAGMKVTVTVR